MQRVHGCASLSDGIEEVFASVGESVSLSCHDASSAGVAGSVEWAVSGEVLSRGSSSLVIAKVSALHAGEYRCSDSADRQRVFSRIGLQILEGECEKMGPAPELSPDSSHLLLLLLVRVSVQSEPSLGRRSSP